jgi:hypothetical protein
MWKGTHSTGADVLRVGANSLRLIIHRLPFYDIYIYSSYAYLSHVFLLLEYPLCIPI